MLWNYCWLFSQTHIRTETKWHKIRLGKCLYVPNQKSDPGGFIPHSTFLSLTSEMLWETDWHTSASSLVQRITSRRSVSGLYKILGQEPLSNLCNFFKKLSLWKWTVQYPEHKKTAITEILVSHDQAPSNNNTSIKQECAGFLPARPH